MSVATSSATIASAATSSAAALSAAAPSVAATLSATDLPVAALSVAAVGDRLVGDNLVGGSLVGDRLAGGGLAGGNLVGDLGCWCRCGATRRRPPSTAPPSYRHTSNPRQPPGASLAVPRFQNADEALRVHFPENVLVPFAKGTTDHMDDQTWLVHMTSIKYMPVPVTKLNNTSNPWTTAWRLSASMDIL